MDKVETFLEYMWQHVNWDWNCIKKLMGVNDESCLFLMSESIKKLTVERGETIIGHNNFDFSQQAGSQKFEVDWSQLVLFLKRPDTVQQTIQQYKSFDPKFKQQRQIDLLSVNVREGLSIEFQDSEQGKKCMLNQFRWKATISEQEIQKQISLLNFQNRIPYLHFLFQKKEELEYLYRYGWVFVKFAQDVHKIFNKQLSRQETIQPFAELVIQHGENNLFQFFKETFVPMWNNISLSGQEFQFDVCERAILPKIEDARTCTINLLLLRKEIKDANNYYKLLENIKDRQNQILD